MWLKYEFLAKGKASTVLHQGRFHLFCRSGSDGIMPVCDEWRWWMGLITNWHLGGLTLHIKGITYNIEIHSKMTWLLLGFTKIHHLCHSILGLTRGYSYMPQKSNLPRDRWMESWKNIEVGLDHSCLLAEDKCETCPEENHEKDKIIRRKITFKDTVY